MHANLKNKQQLQKIYQHPDKEEDNCHKAILKKKLKRVVEVDTTLGLFKLIKKVLNRM